MTSKRWDTDKRLVGAGHARDAEPAVRRLLDTMQQDLLPHIRGSADLAPSIWRFESADGADPNRYVIELEWRRRGGNWRDLVADAYTLIGRIAETDIAHCGTRRRGIAALEQDYELFDAKSSIPD